MKNLTPRQQEILDLIRSHITRTGFPPTRMDICNALGFRSPNAAEEHLKALARKGVIQLTSGASRGIRLTSPEDPHSQTGAGQGIGGLARQVTGMLDIPLVGRVAAGHPILAQEHIESSYAIDPGLFAQAPDYLLRVRGMSMRDAGILDNDLLAVRRVPDGDARIRNGQIVVARLHDDVTVKRFMRHKSDIHLLPENPEFKPIVIKAGEASSHDFTIEGLGIGIIRNPASLA
jgi:repressor LexA